MSFGVGRLTDQVFEEGPEEVSCCREANIDPGHKVTSGGSAQSQHNYELGPVRNYQRQWDQRA